MTRDGRGVFGASVAAINLDRNLIYTALTESDGSYSFAGPGTGRYAVYAEPLNGPAKPDQLLGSGSSDGYYTDLDDVQIFGTGIAVDRSRPARVLTDKSGSEVGIGFLVRVASDAAPGPRAVAIKVGDEQAAGTGGVVVTPRSIPAAILYFPYLLATQDHYTGIALVNPSLTPAAVRVVARDGQGVLLYDRDAVIPADLAIAPAAQTARLERQIFNLPADSKQAGSVIVESDNREVQGFFLAGDLSSNYLDGADAFTRGRRELCFTDILQNAETTTEIHLMNIKDIAASIQLALIGGSGAILKGPLVQTIPPFGKIGKSVAELFGIKTDLNAAHVTALASDETIVGFSYIRQRDAAFGLNAQSPEGASEVLYSPQLAVGKFGVTYRTRLNIVNAGGSPAAVTVELLGDNGLPLSGTSRYTPPAIAAGGQLAVDTETYFGLAGKGSLQGSIRVSAPSGSKLMGNVVFGDGDPTKGRLDFGAALPLYSSGSADFIFSQVAEGSGFYTGLAFMAPEGATVQVAACTQDGKLVGSGSLILAPTARSVSLLQALIPATRGQVGGYLRVTSTKPVIGFELFGATNGRFLSAVPPQRQLY